MGGVFQFGVKQSCVRRCYSILDRLEVLLDIVGGDQNAESKEPSSKNLQVVGLDELRFCQLHPHLTRGIEGLLSGTASARTGRAFVFCEQLVAEWNFCGGPGIGLGFEKFLAFAWQLAEIWTGKGAKCSLKPRSWLHRVLQWGPQFQKSSPGETSRALMTI